MILVGSDTDYRDDDDPFCGRKNWTQRRSLGPTAASSGDGVKCRNLHNLPCQAEPSSSSSSGYGVKKLGVTCAFSAPSFSLSCSKTWGKINLHCHHTITTFLPLSVTYKKHPLPPGAPRFHPRNKQSLSWVQRDCESLLESRVGARIAAS